MADLRTKIDSMQGNCFVPFFPVVGEVLTPDVLEYRCVGIFIRFVLLMLNSLIK